MTAAKYLTSIALALALSPVQADVSANWLAQIGGKGADLVFDITETADGRICATGTFWDKVTFGTGNQQKTLEALEAQDIYVACYTADGELIFATEFGAHRGDDPRAITALKNGDLIVAGFFASEFGAGKSKTLKSNGNGDIFVTRLDKAGNEVWSRQFGGKFADIASSLNITPDGDILLAGNFQLSMGYKIDGDLQLISSAGSRDAFVMKLDDDGDVAWVRQFGGKGFDSAKAVASDSDGNVYIAGTFHGSAGFKENDPRLDAVGHADVFLASYTADGDARWVRHVSGIQQEDVSGLIVNRDDKIFLAGNFQNEITLDEKSRLSNAGVTDVFVARYSAAGELERAASFGGPGIEQTFDLALSAGQSLLLAGHFQDNTDFAPGDAVELRRSVSKGNSDAFVATIDADLKLESVRTFGGAGLEMVLSVAALQDSGVAMAGVFNTPFEFGIGNLNIEDRGKTDVFIVRVNEKHELVASE